MLNPVYDPMQEGYWTLPMCVAWIAYRNLEAVQHQMNDFRANEWAAPEASVTLLLMEDTDEDYRTFSRLMSCHKAKDALWRALRDGELLAHGVLDRTAIHTPIEPITWLRLDAEELDDAVRTPYPPYQTSIRYTDVRIARGYVLGLWPSVEGSEVAEPAATRVDDDIFQIGRWPLLPTLAWIMSRDVEFTRYAAQPDKYACNLGIRLSVVGAYSIANGEVPKRYFYRSARNAFSEALAPAFASGAIKAAGFRYLKKKLGGESPCIPDAFPPSDLPLEAVHSYQVGDEPGGSLEPIGSEFAHERWIFKGLTFSRDDVLRLWPEGTTDTELQANDRAIYAEPLVTVTVLKRKGKPPTVSTVVQQAYIKLYPEKKHPVMQFQELRTLVFAEISREKGAKFSCDSKTFKAALGGIGVRWDYWNAVQF